MKLITAGLLLLLSFAKSQRIGILSDVHFDPQLLHQIVRHTWESSIADLINNKNTTSVQSPRFAQDVSLVDAIVITDIQNAADTMQKVCQLMEHNPAVVVAVTRSSCNLQLAVLSSALSIPVLEIPIEFKADPPHRCEFSMLQPIALSPDDANKDRRKLATVPPFDGAVLGNYFVCHAGERIILVYDNTIDTQTVSSFVEGLDNRMRRTTVQKLPTFDSDTDFHITVLDLATDLINTAVNELWDLIEEMPDTSDSRNTVSFIIFGGEETIQKFVLHFIPELPYSFFVHFYIVDTGWTSYYFAQSLLFSERVTVITIPEKYEVSPTMSEKQTAHVIKNELTSGFKSLLSSLYQQSRIDKRTMVADHNVNNSCRSRIEIRKSLKQLTRVIQDGVIGPGNASKFAISLRERFPFFATIQLGSDAEKRNKLQTCDMRESGGIACRSLTSQINDCNHPNHSRAEHAANSYYAETIEDEINGDVFLGMTSWKNKTFRVATVEDEPFVFVHNDSDGNVKFSGFSIDLLHMLSEMLEFQYELYQVADRKYGAFKNGKWNGLVGDVVGKKADFAIAAMTITPQRETVVDFTKRYMDYAVGILMKKPRTVTNLFAFLNPFDNSVWYSIIAGLFLVSILLYVLNRVSPKQMRGPPYHDTSLHGTFWFVYSSLVQQGTDMNLVTLSSQIVTGVWWFFILIIISSYTANLAAHLTITRLENHITSFRDLAKQTEIAFGTARDTSIYDFLRTKGSNAKDHSSMWARLWKVSNGTNSVSDPKQGFNRVKHEHYAFLWDVAVIEYLILTDQDCMFSTVPDSIYDKGYGIAVQHGNPIREALSLGILQLQDRGEVNRLKQRWWTSVGKCPMDHSQKRSHSSELTIENFAGVFCVLACGLVIASMVAAVELMQYVRYSKKTKKKKDMEMSGVASQERQRCFEMPKVYVQKCVGNEIHIVLKRDQECNQGGEMESEIDMREYEDAPIRTNGIDKVWSISGSTDVSTWWPRNRKIRLDETV